MELVVWKDHGNCIWGLESLASLKIWLFAKKFCQWRESLSIYAFNIFDITPGQMITEALENATAQVAIKNLLVASGVFTMKVRMYLSSRDVYNYNMKNWVNYGRGKEGGRLEPIHELQQGRKEVTSG